jgi:uncharacterized protein YndB with AHSA1/START domain
VTERAIEHEVSVPASIGEVWAAWTTADGARAFFAPECHIDPRPFGEYEIYFQPEAEHGSRGAENNFVMAVQPERMVSFTWDAPPTLPETRGQRTFVTVRLEPEAADRTRVRIHHTGWGEGGQWDEAFEYFESAWQVVLARLRSRFVTGPIDWSDPPRESLTD